MKQQRKHRIERRIRAKARALRRRKARRGKRVLQDLSLRSDD